MSRAKAKDAPLIPAGRERMVSPNFLSEIIERDLGEGKYMRIVTRFPPEPNGYAHIGHAIASYLNFGLAHDYGGACRLRMDDTNPETEKQEYADALIEDMRWLGWRWEGPVSYASNYFDKLYDFAVTLIKRGKAYVDSVSDEEMARLRGTVDTPGTPSPYRDRSVEENLELLVRMRRGEFKNGEHVLRAKIDLASPNMKLRDPVLYRIVHARHYRTGDAWCIYPSYDFAQATSDALDGVTHSFCTLEFVDNRAIYDWLMEELWTPPRPYQYEFGRRSLEYTVVSKRKLNVLVNDGHVSGWDDPRMPTLAGLRRRGVRPEAIRAFAGKVGISRTNRTVDIALLEHAIRDDLNYLAPRVMAVLEPLKVTLTNYTHESELLELPYWPHDVPKEGSRKVPFSRTLYIERGDFAEDPPKGWRRLSPGAAVRLRHAYVIRCDEVVKDEHGEAIELRCSYDPDTLGKNPAGKVLGPIHWLSAEHALPAEFRLYDRLFSVPNPDEGEGPFTRHLNPASLVVKKGYVEPSVRDDDAATRYQFERQGYFWRDPVDGRGTRLVFNRIVTLRDSWAKQASPDRSDVAAVKASEADVAGARKKPPQAAGETPDPTHGFTDEQLSRYARWRQLGLAPEDAALIAAEASLSGFFAAALAAYDQPQALANWTVNELWREVKERRKEDEAFAPEDFPFGPRDFARLVALVGEGTINARTAKGVFAKMLAEGGDPLAIVEREGLTQLSDENALEALVNEVLRDHPEQLAAYRGGKEGLMGFFVGQVMRRSQGRADPQLVQKLLRDELG